MNPRRILNEIRDELDSRQITVTLSESPFGIIVGGDYASKIIAKAELRRRGILVAEQPSALPQG